MKNKFKLLFYILGLSIFVSNCTDKHSLDEKTYKKLTDGLYANLITTKGNMLIQLEMEKTPITVANFVALAEGKMKTSTKKGKFYNGLIFHRIIDGFMIQGGDPEGTGDGGPGYNFADEFDPSLTLNTKGIVAMANSGPNTNGSQFFITDKATTFLNGKHTVFGKVILGLETIDAIDSEPKDEINNKPLKDIKIKKIEIIRKGTKAETFDAVKIFEGRNEATMEEKAATIGIKMNEEAILKLKAAITQQLNTILEDYKNLKTKIDQSTAKTTNGIQYLILEKGQKNAYTEGETAHVNYALFKPNAAEILDTSLARGQEFSFKIGAGQTIKGWDEILTTLNRGTKVYVKIPPALGYGNQDMGVIPPNSTLYFYLEIL